MSSVYNQSVNSKTVHHNTHQTSIVKIVLLNHNESQMKSEDNEVVMITGNGSKLSTLSSDHCSDRTRVSVWFWLCHCAVGPSESWPNRTCGEKAKQTEKQPNDTRSLPESAVW